MSHIVPIVVHYYAELCTVAGLVAGAIAVMGMDNTPASGSMAVCLLTIGASSWARRPR